MAKLIRPYVDRDEVGRLMLAEYGLEIKNIDILESYCDRNFLVETLDGNEFVLKVTNPDESRFDSRLCTIHVRNLHGFMFWKKLFPVPYPESPKKECVVRLLTYLPGCPLGSYPHLLGKDTFQQLGALLADFHETLKDFPSTGLGVEINNKWLAEKATTLLNLIASKEDADITTIVTEAVKEFERKLRLLKPSMDIGIIHGDFHINNIIINPTPTQCQGFKSWGSCQKAVNEIYGIIDFNEISYTLRVQDIGNLILGAWINIKCNEKDGILIGAHVISGYLSSRDLGESDLEMIYDATVISCCQNAVIGQHDLILENGENHYFKSLADDGRRWLKFLHDTGRSRVCAVWNEVLVEHGFRNMKLS